MSRILEAASSIALVTLGSRILGLIRDVIMFRALGASWAMGAFVVAWMFPNLLRRLFGEGALSAAFVPIYTRELEKRRPEDPAIAPADPSAARQLLGTIVRLLLIGLGALVTIVVVLAFVVPPEWVGRPESGATAAEHGRLLLRLTVILFPYCIPICLAAILAGALNCHGRFALPAAAPIVLNVLWIIGAGVAASSSTDLETIATTLAAFLLVGGLLQLLLIAIPLVRLGEGPLRRPSGTAVVDPLARQVLVRMAPAVLGMSLLQINTVVDQVLATYLVSAGAPSYLYMANRLLLFPHALTSLALATAAFPSLAQHAARAEHAVLRDRLEQTLHATMWAALPASVGMMLLAEPLIQLVFEHGAFGAEDRSIAARTTMCLVAALPAIGSAQLHARALFALGDTRTPAMCSALMLVANVVLNLLLVLWLDLGTPGLATATTLCAIGNHFLLRQRLLVLCPQPPSSRRSLLPILLGTTLMALSVHWVQRGCTGPEHSRFAIAIYEIGLPMLSGIVVYVVGCRLSTVVWRRIQPH